MSSKLIWVAPMALSIMLCFGSNASAQSYNGFVKDSFYIGKGGKAVGLKDFAANPQRHVRSDVVLLALREHFSRVVGKPLGDAEFRALLASDEVRLTACTGQINTAGVTSSGKIAWHERKCYKNEQLIEVKVLGGWMVAASQGCYNPVEGVRPPPPKVAVPTPEDGVCGKASGPYAATDTTLRGDLCVSGYPTSFVTLPRPGHSATYTCFPRNGGKSASCPISVQAEAPPPPAPPAPVDRKITQAQVTGDQTVVGVPALVVPAFCGGPTIAVGGTSTMNYSAPVQTRFLSKK